MTAAGLPPGRRADKKAPGTVRVLGTEADDPNDYIIYDRHTGHLYIDVDGNGVEEQILFATLSNKPKLDAEDFW